MAGSGLAVVVVGETVGALVQAARIRAGTTITTIPSLRTMLVLLSTRSGLPGPLKRQSGSDALMLGSPREVSAA
jgi:hypothetical protein